MSALCFCWIEKVVRFCCFVENVDSVALIRKREPSTSLFGYAEYSRYIAKEESDNRQKYTKNHTGGVKYL
jgi:hypothetical protein